MIAEMRSEANRLANADHANLVRTAHAAQRQLDAARGLRSSGALESLPSPLAGRGAAAPAPSGDVAAGARRAREPADDEGEHAAAAGEGGRAGGAVDQLSDARDDRLKPVAAAPSRAGSPHTRGRSPGTVGSNFRDFRCDQWIGASRFEPRRKRSGLGEELRGRPPPPLCALRDQTANGVWIHRPGARAHHDEYEGRGAIPQLPSRR